MNKLELAKAVRDTAKCRVIRGENMGGLFARINEEIADTFEYLAKLIEELEDGPQLVGGTDAGTADAGDLRDRGDVECGTAEPLTYKRRGGTRDIYRVWYGKEMVGPIEKVINEAGPLRWKVISTGQLFDRRHAAGSRLVEVYRATA